MKILKIASNPFEVSIKGPKGNERLKIEGEYPRNDLSEKLFNQFGLMHIIAPYLPRIVQADFPIFPQIKDLISKMYQAEKKQPPKFQTPKGDSEVKLNFPKTNPNRVTVAYSAGKDTLWNMWWAQEKFGKDNVLGVHIKGLNRNVGNQEYKYTLKQKKELEFANFQIINLLNSSQNTGYSTMRSRDMFLSGVIIPPTVEFGASKIITEGFEEAKPTEPFSGLEKNMIYFNKLLKDLGIPVQVAWKNREEMDVIKDLLIHRPKWLEQVQNCFAAPCYIPPLRRSWEKRAPSFPLYESQCGSCVKCRITNVARILYDSTMKTVKTKDIKTYLETTAKWIKERRVELRDMIEGSFLRDFGKAAKQYGITSP